MKNYKKYWYGLFVMLFMVMTAGVLSACGGGGTTKYSVTFDDMYGSKVVQKVEKGGVATEIVPDVPVEDVYDQYGNVVSTEPLDVTFYKWYTDQQFISEYNFASPVTSNVTLYARWITDRVVSFDVGGGTPLDNIRVGVIRSQEEIEELTGVVMEKEGYAFKGWYTDSELNNPVVYPYILTGNKTLYAKWDVEGFLVTFYCINGVQCKDPFNVITPNQKLGLYVDNDGTIGIESVNAYIDLHDNEHGDKFYGYEFEGWYTEPTFEPSSRIDESDYMNITIDNSMNIYGNFIIKDFSVTVHYNIATKPDLNGTVFLKRYKSILQQSELMTISTSSGNVAVTNEGKKIKGWYTDEDCTKPYDFSKNITENIMLFVEWENISGYINVDYNNGFIGSDSFAELEETPGTYIEDIYDYLNLEEPVRKGYEFIGWSYEFDNYYTCTWFKDEDGSLAEYSCTNGTEKYIYTGASEIKRWYLNGDVTGDVAGVNFTYLISQIDNKQINAVWEGTEYTVILNYYDGTSNADHTLEGKYAYDSIIYSSSIELVEKVGYELKGFAWTNGLTTCTTGTCFTFPITLGSVIDAGLDDDETIRLYGVYEAKKLDVIFNSNGGSFGQSGAYYILPGTAVNPSHVIKYNTTWDYEFMSSVFGNSVQNPSLYLAKTDYQFVGWSTNKNASTEAECQYVHKPGNSITFNNTTTITYYAIWKNDAKLFTFNGKEYDTGSSTYIDKVTTFSANIGLSINIYSYYKSQTGNELNTATEEITNNGQFVGWYYCLAAEQTCVATDTNRLNADTYVTIQANVNFYAEYAPTKLSYRLVDTGVSKYYSVSGLYPGISADDYIRVEIPSYYLGYTVSAISTGVFDNCNNIVELVLPTTLSNTQVKGKFTNSLKIVNLTITKDVLSYLGTTGASIFGENSTYMIAKICELNIHDLGNESIDDIVNRLDLDLYASLTTINGTYLNQSSMVKDITINLLLNPNATLIQIGRDGYPSAYMAGYTFMGWKLATSGSGSSAYVKYTYSLDSVVVGSVSTNYDVSGEYISFEGNLSDLNNKYLIAVFEKWCNTLTIYDVDDTTTPLFNDDKDSGDLLYSDDYTNDLKSSNTLFAGFFYDEACINPVLAEDRMPFTKPLTIYAKFISNDIEVTFTEANNSLKYVLKDASVDEVYVARYYKGVAVNYVEISLKTGVSNVTIENLYVPASYAVIQGAATTGAINSLFITTSSFEVENVIIYGSNDEEVVASRIAIFSDMLTTITLYDNLTVAADAFDEFELLEKFVVVCTGGTTSVNVGGNIRVVCNTVDRNLLVSNDILYREEGSSYYLVRVPINHATIDFSSAQTGTSIVGGDIPSTVIGIDAHAFNKCSKVVKLTVPTNIKYIGEYAFANMTSLVSIDGMADVEVIANVNVFENNIMLASVSISVGNGNYTSSEGVILNSEKTKLIFFPKAYEFANERIYYLPTTIQTISSGAFDLRESKSIIISIGPSVSVIANDAFFNIAAFRLSSTSTSLAVDNGNLYKYRMNDDKVELYELIRFADASGESLYVLPNTIESINPYAFTNASSLTRIIYDNKTKLNTTMQGVEKNILIGNFVGNEKISVYENFEEIEILGYNQKVYISDHSTFTAYEVYEKVLEGTFEAEFRTWMRVQGYIVGEIDNEVEEIASLNYALSSTGFFTINGVDTRVPSFTTIYPNVYDNFKFSRWVQSLGLNKGESVFVEICDENVCISGKDTGIPVSSVNKGEIYMHFIDEKELFSEDGMVRSIEIPTDSHFDIRYAILTTKDIYLISIADVYYNGELVPEDTNGSYKVSDNGILSTEPITSYQNLDFRGWYVQNATVVGIYGTRIKFPLMIKDLPVAENELPRLSAAFTIAGFTSTITLKIDYNIHGFVWNKVEYAAPGYTWCNMVGAVNSCSSYATGNFDSLVDPIRNEDGIIIKKLVKSDSSKVLNKGYWMANVVTDGNSVVTNLPTIDGGVGLYYKTSAKTDTNKYKETYHLVSNSFFSTLESMTIYVLPSTYVSSRTTNFTLDYNDGTGTVVINTCYFDPESIIKSGYHILDSGAKFGIETSLISSGVVVASNAVGAGKTYKVINQTTTRTNVTIKVYVTSSSYKDQLRLVVGQYTYSHSELDHDDDGYFYTFTCKDDSASSAFYAIEGGIIDFNLVTVQEGTKAYSFTDKYRTPHISTTTSDKFYLTGEDLTIVTSLK